MTGERPAPQVPDLATLLGGRRGVVDASVPGIVLVSVDVATELRWAIAAAVAAAAVLAVVRILRGEPLRQAAYGVVGMAAAALLAAKTGNAKTFFLPGIIVNVVYAALTLASVLARRPVLGYVAAMLDRRYAHWRTDERLRRAALYATLVWFAVFGSRALVQGWLYVTDHETWLATMKLAMGWPLWGVALATTLLLLEEPELEQQTEAEPTA